MFSNIVLLYSGLFKLRRKEFDIRDNLHVVEDLSPSNEDFLFGELLVFCVVFLGLD
jgi:hypothetical protein